MGDAGYAVGSSTALATARRRGRRLRAEMSVPFPVRLCDIEAALGHKVRAVASDRHRRPNGSRASGTTFTTIRQNGAASYPAQKPVRRILHEMANMDASATDGARVRGVGLRDGADSFRPWWSHRSVSRQIQSDSALRAARHRRWDVQFGVHAVARQSTSRQNLFHRAGEFGFPLGLAV
jgi:hypothetical protein